MYRSPIDCPPSLPTRRFSVLPGMDWGRVAVDWEGPGRSYQEAVKEDLIQATKVGESQVKVTQESVRDSVEMSDLSDRVNCLQECLSPNSPSSDDLLSSEDDSKDGLLEWFYVKRGVKQGTMEIVYTSLQDLEGHVNNENYQGLELVEGANEKDCLDLEVERGNVCEEDLLDKSVEREDIKMEYVNTKYCQDTSLPGKNELKQKKGRKSLVLNEPKKKSRQLLSKEALEIFSASTEPVHKKPIFNKKVYAKKLLCTERGKCFCLKNQLEKHMKVLKKPTIDMKVIEKNVLCAVCGKYFLRKNHLESHMRNIHKSKLLACKIGDCGMTFCDKRLFHSHKLKAHNILV